MAFCRAGSGPRLDKLAQLPGFPGRRGRSKPNYEKARCGVLFHPEDLDMEPYSAGRGRVIEVGSKSLIGGIGALVGLFLLIIGLWASIAYVPTGHVGVLTMFGR